MIENKSILIDIGSKIIWDSGFISTVEIINNHAAYENGYKIICWNTAQNPIILEKIISIDGIRINKLSKITLANKTLLQIGDEMINTDDERYQYNDGHEDIGKRLIHNLITYFENGIAYNYINKPFSMGNPEDHWFINGQHFMMNELCVPLNKKH